MLSWSKGMRRRMWRQILSSFFMLSAAKTTMLCLHLEGYLPFTTAFSENMLCCGLFLIRFQGPISFRVLVVLLLFIHMIINSFKHDYSTFLKIQDEEGQLPYIYNSLNFIPTPEVSFSLKTFEMKITCQEMEEDGRGVRWGDCQTPSKYIKNSSRYGTTPPKQPLGDSRRPQDSRGKG